MFRFNSRPRLALRVSVALMTMAATLVPAASWPQALRLDSWTRQEKAVLASLNLKRLPPPPVDPSNAVEQHPSAVELGRRLFNDTRFSRNGAVSCASCHDPAKQFQDGLQLGRGVGLGGRRSMPIVGAGYGNWLFWDGRKDSLWSQALGPLEDGVEHATTRTRVAHLIAEHYRKDYERVFAALPSLEGLPSDAGPLGNAAEKKAWAAISEPQREAVSRLFANAGKAIAAYEKSLSHQPSRLDRYLDIVAGGEPDPQPLLQPHEIRGLRLFIGKAQCVSCHNGPLFTDQQFHNTGVAPRNAARPDRGRAAATAKVRDDEFNCLGKYSDALPGQCQELRFMVSDEPSLEGAFKTPGLRGVAQRPPYMHAGQFSTLEQVLRHYVAAPSAVVGRSELVPAGARHRGEPHARRSPIQLTEAELADLVSFLGSLSPAPPPSAAPR